MMELICGACHGRLLAELPGSTVACPHCGTHLQTPAAEPAPQMQGAVLTESGGGPVRDPDPAFAPPAIDTVRTELPAPPQPVPAAPFPNQNASGSVESIATGSAAVATNAAQVETAPDSPRVPAPIHSAIVVPAPVEFNAVSNADISDAPNAETCAEICNDSAPTPSAVETAAPAPPANNVAPASVESVAEIDDPHKTTTVGEFVANVATAAAGSHVAHDEIAAGNLAPGPGVFPGPFVAPAELPSEGRTGVEPRQKAADKPAARAGVSPMVFMIVVSYASAMTLACLYLAFQLLNNPRTYDLPDLAPPKPKDKKSVMKVIYVSPNQELPPANVLRLGESRQYGSLKVTPLSVTRGKLQFEYYEPEAQQKREPEGPVLKLHLRFENVSGDQEFIPLDGNLVFTKKIDETTYGLLKANNFVCNVSDRKKPAKLVFTYDLTPNGNWLLTGENLDREIAPGQVIETYIPTAPDQIESLSGDLVWRVHFRKGYNRQSFRGVTTLIEVLFKDSEIVDDEEPDKSEPTQGTPAKKKPAAEQSTVKDA